MLSVRARWMLQAARLIAAITITALVIAIWTIPQLLAPVWLFATFFLFGLPGALANFAIKADDRRRANVR